jgi:hypothetical protein
VVVMNSFALGNCVAASERVVPRIRAWDFSLYTRQVGSFGPAKLCRKDVIWLEIPTGCIKVEIRRS